MFLVNIFSSFFFLRINPPVSQGLIIHEISRSHTTMPESVGLLQTSDQPVAETST